MSLVTVSVRNDWSVVTSGDALPLYYALSFEDPNKEQSDAYNVWLRNEAGRKMYGPDWAPPDDEPEWDGWHKFFDWEKQRFPTGLLSKLREALEGTETEVAVADTRTDPYPQFHHDREVGPVAPWDIDWVFGEHKPRDYQTETIELALAKKRGVIAAGTGAGKTMMAMAIIAALDLPTLFIVPNKELLHQTYQNFHRAGFPGSGISVGRIGDGRFEVEQVTIATHQTLHSRREDAAVQKLLADVPMVFYDECHRASADTVYRIMMGCGAYYRFGLSGTPHHTDLYRNWRLTAAFGDVIKRITPIYLTKEGYLTLPVIIRLPNLGEPEMRFHPKMPYARMYQKAIVNNPARNQTVKVAVDWLMHWGRPTVVIVKQHKHLDHFRKLFADVPYGVRVLSGKDASEERVDALQAMRDGLLDVIVATNIFDEGVDVPNLGAVVLAAGEKSPIRLRQRIGRGMRKDGESNTMVLVDPLDSQHGIMINHSKKRDAVYKEERYPVFRGWEALTDLPQTERQALQHLEGLAVSE